LDTKQRVGKKIKELRKQAGMTQEQLANQAHIDPQHMSRLERGMYFPSLETLELIAQNLGVLLKDLFVFPEDETAEMLRAKLIDAIGIMNEQELRRVAKLIRPSLP
jgi:transcriptional regulator with XRE-family HTH domain